MSKETYIYQKETHIQRHTKECVHEPRHIQRDIQKRPTFIKKKPIFNETQKTVCARSASHSRLSSQVLWYQKVLSKETYIYQKETYIYHNETYIYQKKTHQDFCPKSCGMRNSCEKRPRLTKKRRIFIKKRLLSQVLRSNNVLRFNKYVKGDLDIRKGTGQRDFWKKPRHTATTATHCNTLHHTATHCNTLQHTATHFRKKPRHSEETSEGTPTATHCNTLQHTATHCNTLQHTATHCNTLPKET